MRLMRQAVRPKVRADTLGKAASDIEYDAKLHMKPRTLATLKRNLKVLEDHFGLDAKVAALTAARIQAFIGWCEEDERSPNTVREKYLPLLRQVFERAKVAWPKGIRAPRARRRTMAYFTPEEIQVVLGKMRASGYPTAGWHADLVELLAVTGMRAGELCRLNAGDLRPDRLLVSVIDAKAGGGRREVPVSAERTGLLERLRARAEEQHRARHPEGEQDPAGPGVDDAPVLPGGQDYLRLMLRRWRKRLDEPRLNGRALRHSLGTTLHALGVAMPDAMAWMGHSTTSSHIRYLHAAQSRQRRAADLLTEAMPPSSPPQAHGQDAPASEAT